MAMVGRRTVVDVMEKIERAIEAAKKLRCLNMFITETFDDAQKQAHDKQITAKGITTYNKKM